MMNKPDDTPITSTEKVESTIDKILKALLAKDSTQNVKIMFLDMMISELGPVRPNAEEEILKKYLNELTKP